MTSAGSGPDDDVLAPDLGTVLGKVVAVLFSFRMDEGSVPLAEFARRTGIAKGTLHRLLGDLVDARLLDRREDGYRLGNRVFQLGMRASVERGLLEVATPFMEDLYERTHETVHLGVLDGDAVVYVAKFGGHRQVDVPSRVGGRMPLHCTAIGKVLLAWSTPELSARVLTGQLARRTPRTVTAPGLLRRQLERIRETGIAFEHEESAVGVVCVAAPILDAEGEPMGAISVSGPVTRFRPESAVPSLRAATAGVSAVVARRAQHPDVVLRE